MSEFDAACDFVVLHPIGAAMVVVGGFGVLNAVAALIGKLIADVLIGIDEKRDNRSNRHG